MRTWIVVFILIANQAWADDTFFNDIDRLKAVNLGLKSQEERWQSLKAVLFSKKMAWTPTITAGVGRTSNPMASTVSLDTDYWKTDFVLNLWNGGSDVHGVKGASLDLEAQNLNRLNEALKLEARGAELIFRTIYSMEVIRSTRELVKMREESHRIVNEKYKQGKVPFQEVSKSEIDKVQQESRLRTLEAEHLEIQSQWKGLLQDEIKTTNWPFEAGMAMTVAKDTLSLPTQRLEKLAESARESWRALQGKHLASIDLSASYQEFPIKSPTYHQWSTSILLTIPLWSRYETSAGSATAFSNYTAAQTDFEQAKQAESAQRDVLMKRLDLYYKSLVDSKRYLEKARQLYADMVKSFRYGRMSVNDLLLEQNRLIDSELSLSQNQLSYHKVVVENCAMAGLPLRQCLSKAR